MPKLKPTSTVRTIELIEKTNKVDFVKSVNAALRNPNYTPHGHVLITISGVITNYTQAFIVETQDPILDQPTSTPGDATASSADWASLSGALTEMAAAESAEPPVLTPYPLQR